MARSPVTPYVLTMPSSTTLTASLDLQHSYREIALCIPSMTSATQICVRVASERGYGYYPIYDNLSKDLMVIPTEPNLAQSVQLPITAMRFIKLEFSTQVQQDLTFEILCSE